VFERIYQDFREENFQFETMSDWPQRISTTAEKYLRYGYVDMVPFEPGQRYRARRELETRVKGYKGLRTALGESRKELEDQRSRSLELEPKPFTAFYKSPVNTRTFKISGSIWITEALARSSHFTVSTLKY